MNTLPLWSKISIGAVGIVVLTLVGFKFDGIELLPSEEKRPSEKVSKPTPTPTQVTSNPTPKTVDIKILVENANNKKPVENAEVKLKVSNGSPVSDRTDGDGYARFTIPKGIKVRVSITKEGFKMKDKIYNETINPNEVKTYYLTPEKDISYRKPFSIPSTKAVIPSPSFKVSPPAIKPSPFVKTSPIVINTAPASYPKTLPTESTNQRKVSRKTYNDFELELLNNFIIDIFFLKEKGKVSLANGIKNQLNNDGIKAKIVLRGVDVETLRKAANRAPNGFEVRADYDEIPAGRLLVNMLINVYPNLGFRLIKKRNTRLYTDNYMSIFLDTFPDEYEYEYE